MTLENFITSLKDNLNLLGTKPLHAIDHGRKFKSKMLSASKKELSKDHATRLSEFTFYDMTENHISYESFHMVSNVLNPNRALPSTTE